MQIIEGNLIFDFDCDAIKFDDSTFYRKHFSKMTNGIKAVDILAVNQEIGYLIEISNTTLILDLQDTVRCVLKQK